MKIIKKLWKLGIPGYIIIGLLAGILTGGGWFAWAAIQSQVGLNTFTPSSGAWNPACEIIPGVAGADGNTLGTVTTFPCTWADMQVIQYLFNGTTWDRPRSSSNAADALATNAVGNQNAISFPFVFNGTTFDRIRSVTAATSSTVTDTTTGISFSYPLMRNSTGTSYSALRSLQDLVDGSTGVVTLATGGQYLFNNSTYDRSRSASAANLTATTSVGSPTTVPLSTWSITNTPAAATQATVSKASGGGTIRHVATSITVCLASTAVGGNAPLNFNLRDGATGAGTILWTTIQTTAGIANGGTCTTLSGLAMIGTAATAMTIESAAAPAANGTATVTLTGFSVP